MLVELSAAASRVESPPPSDAFGALDEVLAADRADPIAGVEPAARDADAELAGAPSRAETAAAIERIAPIVRACAANQAGRVVELRIVFASSGHVTTATVASDGVRLTPSQRSCVARAVRRARVPAFERARFEVTYPMRF
ncbi:MAG TPA: hypothetical protein VIL20_17155 [Sandaracinaceae bacterium]